MLLSVKVTEKSFGSNQLYSNIEIEIQEGEKVGLVGRNGTGKSTLFNIMCGVDQDFQGEVREKSGITIISSRQEHHEHDHKTVLEYIQGDLPEYQELIGIIDSYPETMGSNPRKIQKFSDTLERFNELGYYQLEDDLRQSFDVYQIDPATMHRTLSSLSGGQKRMIELIKVQRSRGDLSLIDEPTNHMDYVSKAAFVKWMTDFQEAVLVITHDRDVLDKVDRIIEIRDGKSYAFRGNYSAYLKTNTSQVTSEVSNYDQTQRRIDNLEQDVIRFRRLKEKSRNPSTIKRFKSQELKARAELAKLQSIDKPSFWIDQESASNMTHKLAGKYEEYKATNIKVRTKKPPTKSDSSIILRVDNLSLGYKDTPLFDNVNFMLRAGEKLRLHGRNGAGKTTLIKSIAATRSGTAIPSQVFSGEIEITKDLGIGIYEQEIDSSYLGLTLSGALERILLSKNQIASQQSIKQLMGDYLFNPATDGDMIVSNLSGGQKARLQIISMLAGGPSLLILDEPTNHLDLPSIEELENALRSYSGSIMYISHDSFFASKLGGETLIIDKH
ncbi:ABC-F family ATP-binding cassette domain-containing protein [Candidatus Saccharibacteria bacterium]|nr:ABC-F family ATP-binding cassette domain-containing protein [Candidatus Saccharibacteria bacterium]